MQYWDKINYFIPTMFDFCSRDYDPANQWVWVIDWDPAERYTDKDWKKVWEKHSNDKTNIIEITPELTLKYCNKNKEDFERFLTE